MKSLVTFLTRLDPRMSLKEVGDPLQMEMNPRVSEFRPQKQTIPEKGLHFTVNLCNHAERPCGYYRVFVAFSAVYCRTGRSSLRIEVHGTADMEGKTCE